MVLLYKQNRPLAAHMQNVLWEAILMKIDIECLRCRETGHVDVRYMFNGETYELEYHCESYTGGCNFYRLLPMGFHPNVGDL
jgi:hypothetical protein